MTALVWLLTAVVVILAVLVVGLLRSHATILRALHHAGIDLDPDSENPLAEPPSIATQPGVPTPAGATGVRAADISGTTPTGGTRVVGVNGGDSTLLAFLTAGCTTCKTFWDEFAAGPDLPDGVRLVVVTRGAETESPAAVLELAPEHLVTVQSSAAWNDYRVPVAPYFVLVDGTRGVVVGEGAASSWARVRDLLVRSLADDDRAGTLSRRAVLGGRSRRRPGPS